MKKLSLFLLVTFQLLVIISYVHSQKPPAKPALMWYVLSWPPTFCINLKNGNCKKPIPQDIFTLHGLWPANANGKTISCPLKPDPDWDKLFRLREAKLEIFWPELKENQPKWSIWKHEWQKHGVCIGEDKSEEYFDAAIRINDMFKKGNLFDYLEKNGITPSNSSAYKQEDIIKAVQDVFINSLTPSPSPSPSSPPPPPPRGPSSPPPSPAAPAPAPGPNPAPFNIYLRCTEIDQRNATHAYLNEVVLCTTLDGSSFITCPNRGTSCDRFKNIVLPSIEPTPIAPSPSPSPPLSPPPIPVRFQEETYGTYPMFVQSWAKYIFNG